MPQPKKLLLRLSLFIALIGLAWPMATAQAADGQLQLDTGTIYQKAGGGKNTAEQIMPDLFLPARTKVVEQKAKKAAKARRKIARHNFLTAPQSPAEPLAVKRLFTAKWAKTSSSGKSSGTTTTVTSSTTSTGAILFVIGLAAVLLTLGGIMLGRRYSSITLDRSES